MINKKCKRCNKQISIANNYCDECYDKLPLNDKAIEYLNRDSFWSTK